MNSQKGIAHVLLLLILLIGVAVGVFLVQSQTNFLSLAGGEPIVFKSIDGRLLPLKNKIAQTTSTKVKAELTSPLGPPASVSGPVLSTTGGRTVSYRVGLDPVELNNASFQQYKSSPTVLNIEIKNITRPQFYFVEFKDSNGRVSQRSAQIELTKVSVTPVIPETQQTAFLFSPQNTAYNVGDTVAVKLNVRADLAPVNLFSAKINFSKDILAVSKIDVTNTIVKTWLENTFNNTLGTISLTGGVPNPGYSTNKNSAPGEVAVIYFKALKAGKAVVSFADKSAIYKNSDNSNILTTKNPVDISVKTGGVSPVPTATVTPTVLPTPTPIVSVTPISGTGDGNKDGKTDLVDFSILLTDFNKNKNYRVEVDMNGDGIINTFDAGLLRVFLIQNGIIQS